MMTDRTSGVLGLEFDITLLFCSSLNTFYIVVSENNYYIIIVILITN